MTMNKEIVREAMATLGRIGAQARAAALTPERRREIGRKAARARWARAKKRGKRWWRLSGL